jgi:hypothetical protein
MITPTRCTYGEERSTASLGNWSTQRGSAPHDRASKILLRHDLARLNARRIVSGGRIALRRPGIL